MTNPLATPSIAILVANGFDESHMTLVQRSLTKESLSYKIVAPEQGLVNGWQDNAWGHYFTVDEQISSAMGSDYDFLILIGGERGAAKLKTNPHTRRIINHFLDAQKPVAAIGSGVGLLALSTKSAGLSVCAAQDLAAELTAAQISLVSGESMHVDGAVLTSDGAQLDVWADELMKLISTCEVDVEDNAVAA